MISNSHWASDESEELQSQETPTPNALVEEPSPMEEEDQLKTEKDVDEIQPIKKLKITGKQSVI